MRLTVIHPTAPVRHHSFKRRRLGGKPGEQLARLRLHIALAADTKNITPLPGLPIVLRNNVANRTGCLNFRRDGHASGQAEPGRILGLCRCLPLADQPLMLHLAKRHLPPQDSQTLGQALLLQPGGGRRVRHHRPVDPVAGAEVRHIVKDREQLVILPLTDRVVLVIVTLGALQRQPKPGSAGRLKPIHDALDPKLLLARVVALGLHRVAMKRAGHPLPRGRVRYQITGELIDRKTIERHVVIQRSNHPVTIRPDVARPVRRIARRVGKAREIKPVLSLPFPKMRRRQQPLDKSGITPRGIIPNERQRLLRCRRQSGQIQIQPPHQSGPGSLL